jgi:ABC-type multidrug transport system ATPase subunit
LAHGAARRVRLGHLLAEVEQTCDRVSIIHRRTLATGAVEDLLRDRVGPNALTLRPAARVPRLSRQAGVASVAIEDDSTVSPRSRVRPFPR